MYAAASEEPNKGTYASSATAAACTDTPGWNNGHGFDCAFYAGKGNACAGGIPKPGFAWTLGPMFKNPEKNCCGSHQQIGSAEARVFALHGTSAPAELQFTARSVR